MTMLVARIIDRIPGPNLGILYQTLRKFSHGFSPIKPGVLLVRTPTDVKIRAADYTLNQPICEAKVDFNSESIAPADLKMYNDKLDVKVTEHDTHNELKINVPQELGDQSLCLNICIPHHYCKLVALNFQLNCCI